MLPTQILSIVNLDRLEDEGPLQHPPHYQRNSPGSSPVCQQGPGGLRAEDLLRGGWRDGGALWCLHWVGSSPRQTVWKDQEKPSKVQCKSVHFSFEMGNFGTVLTVFCHFEGVFEGTFNNSIYRWPTRWWFITTSQRLSRGTSSSLREFRIVKPTQTFPVKCERSLSVWQGRHKSSSSIFYLTNLHASPCGQIWASEPF